MDVYLTVLRLIHIGSAIVWVGTAVAFAAFVIPAVKLLGPAGDKFMYTLYKHTRFSITFPIVALGTTLAGILMFIKVTDTFNSDFMSSAQGIVLSIGGLAGILSAGHGGSTLGPAGNEYVKLYEEQEASGTPNPAFKPLQEKIFRHVNISLLLMIIAVAGMAGWRYL